MTSPAIAAVTAGIVATMVPAVVATSGSTRCVVVGITVNNLAARGRTARPEADEYGEEHDHNEDAEEYHDDLLTSRQ